MGATRQAAAIVILAGFVCVLGQALLASGFQVESDQVRVYVFASEASAQDAVEVKIGRPAPNSSSPDHDWDGFFRYEPRTGRNQVDAVRRQLERTSTLRQLVRTVDAKEEADVLVEVIATDYDAPGGRLRRSIVVVRASDRSETLAADFLGQRTDAVRPAAFGAAMQVAGWIAANEAALRP